MAKSEAEWAEWAKAHRVSFEIEPLLEAVEDERKQVGFLLRFFCTPPRADTPQAQRETGDALRDEVGAFVEAAFPKGERIARAEREPGRAVVARAENALQPEVSVTFRVFHADQYLKAVTEGERQDLGRAEKRLAELGLRRGHW